MSIPFSSVPPGVTYAPPESADFVTAAKTLTTDVGAKLGGATQGLKDFYHTQLEGRVGELVHRVVEPIKKEIDKIKWFAWTLFAMVAITLALVIFNLVWSNKIYKALCPPEPNCYIQQPAVSPVVLPQPAVVPPGYVGVNTQIPPVGKFSGYSGGDPGLFRF
jgi:hypothetical protein